MYSHRVWCGRPGFNHGCGHAQAGEVDCSIHIPIKNTTAGLTSSSYLDNVLTISNGEGIWIGEKLASKNLILHDELSRAKPLTDHHP